MLESGESEGFWAVQRAEAIINAAKLQAVRKINLAALDFPDKHPFLRGFVIGSLLTAAILLNFRQPRSK